MAYISKNFYSPKYMDSSKPISTWSNTQSLINPSSHMHSESHQNLTHKTSGYQSTNPTGYANSFNKVGSSYTATSGYCNQRKPVLFKSSKYVITGANNDHRLSENNKEWIHQLVFGYD